ncbi:hypothetical protein K470DRAFT_272930 [Piedraia hortae CBS 480.64]|uniref:Malate dehydrogenase n=1 Tax=Piedraia hortae CBS 480.64 TaxID=1314780 RepID=A0A6A7BSJ1_9PEZI|nr:hypothetical protein K470DRAFT_272930 [Piedraia hortae CBS 480.64]
MHSLQTLFLLATAASAVPLWFSEQSSCDISSASMPSGAILPPPSGTLYHVALGVGSQNYTCSSIGSEPTSVGAVATLYNVSCMAGNEPSILSSLPSLAVSLSGSSLSTLALMGAEQKSGSHYFLDKTTPYFNLDSAGHQYGEAAMHKAASADAPDNTYSVPWLQLQGSEQFKEVYRVNTKGGMPEQYCAEVGNVEVPYSAEYWIYV